MGEAETKAAIEAIKAELGAASIKDMGRVMAELKARHGTARHGQGQRAGEGAVFRRVDRCSPQSLEGSP